MTLPTPTGSAAPAAGSDTQFVAFEAMTTFQLQVEEKQNAHAELKSQEQNALTQAEKISTQIYQLRTLTQQVGDGANDYVREKFTHVTHTESDGTPRTAGGLWLLEGITCGLLLSLCFPPNLALAVGAAVLGGLMGWAVPTAVLRGVYHFQIMNRHPATEEGQQQRLQEIKGQIANCQKERTSLEKKAKELAQQAKAIQRALDTVGQQARGLLAQQFKEHEISSSEPMPAATNGLTTVAWPGASAQKIPRSRSAPSLSTVHEAQGGHTPSSQRLRR